MEGCTMDWPTNFAHRRNADGSYDSICTKCFLTAAWAEKEESLSSSESAHVCEPSVLYLVNQGSIPAPIPMLGLIAVDSIAGADKSTSTHYRKFPLRTKLRLTIKPDRAD
jgi:hypothetical protein